MSTPFTTLISVAELQALRDSGKPLMVFDCTFDLAQPSLGAVQYHETHIPGALHADL
ncbi:MAG: sulfurtransferase, partial [Comamonadaceae bacterium]